MTGVPRPRVLRVGVLVWNAEGIEAVLRAGPSSFCDLQLLPAPVVAGNDARKKRVRQGAPQSPPRVRIPSSRLRRDAQPCASVDQRAEERHAIDSVADAEATRLPQNAEQGARATERAALAEVSEVPRGFAAVLATEVLRFQCVQPREEERKTGIHARESRGPRIGEASAGLAMEQFFFLCERRSRIAGDRLCESIAERDGKRSKKKPRPQKPRTGHPNSF